MSLLRVTWTDAVGGWNAWQTLSTINEVLADMTAVSVGYNLEGVREDVIVLYASKTGEELGGIIAIPRGMVTNIEIINAD